MSEVEQGGLIVEVLDELFLRSASAVAFDFEAQSAVVELLELFDQGLFAEGIKSLSFISTRILLA